MAGNLTYADTDAVYALTAYRKKNALTTNYGQVSNLSVVVVDSVTRRRTMWNSTHLVPPSPL